MRLLAILSAVALASASFTFAEAAAPATLVSYNGNIVQAWSDSAITCISNTTGFLAPPGVGRCVSMVMEAMFDAQAPYTDNWAWNQWNTTLTLPTRRPEEERNDQFRAVAASYAAYGVLTHEFRTFPAMVDHLSSFMRQIGLEPNSYVDLLSGNQNSALDFSSPINVGSTAAGAVLQYHAKDGFNSNADEPGTTKGGKPFSDYTNYAAVNPPQASPLRTKCSELRDVNKWQPLRLPKVNPTPMMDHEMMMDMPMDEHEIYMVMAPNATDSDTIQKMAVPHMANVKPFALANSAEFRPPAPYRNNSNTESNLLADMREIVLMSCNLNDTMKVISDYWANGPDNATPPGQWFRIASDLTVQRQLSLLDSTKLMLGVSGAMFDAGIAAWDAKRFYDTNRPISYIQCLFGKKTNSAWAGPYQGVRNIQLSDFTPYQPANAITPPFAEYVSGHSTFSGAAATVLRAFFGSDDFGGSYTAQPGSSPIEPKIVAGQPGYVAGLTDVPNTGDSMSIGYSPAQPVTLTWPTFTAAAEEAGISRLYGGIHFKNGNVQGQTLGRNVGAKVWNKVLDLTNAKGSSTVLDGAAAGTGSGSGTGTIGAPTTCPGAGPNVMVSFADMFNGAVINGVKLQ